MMGTLAVQGLNTGGINFDYNFSFEKKKKKQLCLQKEKKPDQSNGFYAHLISKAYRNP